MKKKTVEICKIKEGVSEVRQDTVAVERTFLVKVQGMETFSMSCTPEYMEELVTGALFCRGLIRQAEDVEELTEASESQTVQVRICKDRSAQKKEQVPAVRWKEEKLFQLAEQVFEHPGPLFLETGCAHSCALAADGKILCNFEDIGRHNALDKVIGYALRNHICMEKAAAFTTGRISGDYLKKILCTGIMTVVSRAAVTDEAVRLAQEHGIRMWGFVRKGTANEYSLREKESNDEL